MHISGAFKEPEKANIEPEKANIEELFTAKTAANVRKLLDVFGYQTVFGRSDVEKVLDLKPTRSSALLKDMKEHGMIVPVSGQGKGKYRFVSKGLMSAPESEY